MYPKITLTIKRNMNREVFLISKVITINPVLTKRRYIITAIKSIVAKTIAVFIKVNERKS